MVKLFVFNELRPMGKIFTPLFFARGGMSAPNAIFATSNMYFDKELQS